MKIKMYVPLAIVAALFIASSFGFGTAFGYGGGGGSRIARSSFTPAETAPVVLDTPVTAPVAAPAGIVLGASDFAFSRDLTLGSSGNDVVELQKALRAAGFFTYPTNTGYFGTVTRDAVVAFQKAHNITPAVGYVGPLTRAQLQSGARATSSASADDVSLKEMIELFISLGIISGDKAEKARSLI